MKGERGGKAGPGMKKGPWSAEEDRLLIEYVSENGEGNWNSVQKRTGLERCGKSCRLRWANHLRPDLKKGQFTAEEEEMIVRMHIEMGNKWARMASFLLGRTDNEIKNYWNTRIKRRQRAGLPLYPPEMFQRPQQQDELVPMFAGGSVGGEALPAQPRAVTIGYGLMPMLPPPPPPPVMPSWFLQAELPSSQFFGEVSGGGGGLMDVLMQELDGGGGVQQCGDMLLLEEQTIAQERDDNGVENDKGPMELSTMATLKDSRRSIENSIGEGIEVKNGVSSHDDITTLFDMIISTPPSVPTVTPYWYDDDHVGNMSNGEQA